MEMSEILDKLKGLQDVLAEKYDIEAKVEELPKELEVSTEALERYKKEFIEKNAEFETEKEKVSALKLELEEAIRAREKGEKDMDDISSHREYEVLDKQIKEAEAKEDSIRKDLQKEEKKLAELKDDLSNDEEVIKDQEHNVEESRSQHDASMEAYQNQLKDLNQREADISSGIDSEVLYKFQRIIQRNRIGIVAVSGNVCEGCHMILPVQFANEVRRGEKILFCPYCSRVIYYKPAENGEAATDYYSMEDTGGLADFDDDGEDGLIDDEDYIDDESVENTEDSED